MIKWMLGGCAAYTLMICFLIVDQRVDAPLTLTIQLPAMEPQPSRVWGFSPSEEGFNCLALNAYFEARNDTLEGKIAVSQVVMNRAESGRYPDTICGVVRHSYYPGLHMCQFSWYCDGKRDEPLLQHRIEADAWEESKLAARMVINGEFGEYSQATHYHSIHVDPEWANRLEFIGQVGLHRFYLDDR